MAGFDRDRMWSQLQRLDEPRREREPRYLEHLSGGFARTPGCAWGRPPAPLGLHDHDRPRSTRSRLWDLRRALDSSGARANSSSPRG